MKANTFTRPSKAEDVNIRMNTSTILVEISALNAANGKTQQGAIIIHESDERREHSFVYAKNAETVLYHPGNKKTDRTGPDRTRMAIDAFDNRLQT